MLMHSYADKLECTRSPSDLNFSCTKESNVLQTIHICFHMQICKEL